MRNTMYLINKKALTIGGNNGSKNVVNTLRKPLFFVTHFDKCVLISCICF